MTERPEDWTGWGDTPCPHETIECPTCGWGGTPEDLQFAPRFQRYRVSGDLDGAVEVECSDHPGVRLGWPVPSLAAAVDLAERHEAEHHSPSVTKQSKPASSLPDAKGHPKP